MKGKGQRRRSEVNRKGWDHRKGKGQLAGRAYLGTVDLWPPSRRGQYAKVASRCCGGPFGFGLKKGHGIYKVCRLNASTHACTGSARATIHTHTHTVLLYVSLYLALLLQEIVTSDDGNHFFRYAARGLF